MLRHLRPQAVRWPWDEREKQPSVTRMLHDVRLNEAVSRLKNSASWKGYRATWYTTRQAAQRLSENNSRSLMYAPDAILILSKGTEQIVLHIEYERSADRRWFREKIGIWQAYRRAELWRLRGYPSEPKALVMGYRKATADHNSIEPLFQIAMATDVPNVFFRYLDEEEEERVSEWKVHTYYRHLREPAECSIWNLEQPTALDRAQQRR